MKQTIQTLVLVPDELLRAGLLRILVGTRYKAIEVKGGWDSVQTSGKPAPSLVILFQRGDGVEDKATSNAISTMAERAKVVVLADQCEADACRTAVCAGASAYLPRSIAADSLLRVLDLVQAGEVVFPGALAARVLGCAQTQQVSPHSEPTEHPLQPVGDSRLSSREIEILQRLVHGESNKQISRQLDISETTVKVHIKAVLRKLRVSNRTQAAIWGLEHLFHGAGSHSRPGPTSPGLLQAASASSTTVQPAPITQRSLVAVGARI